MRRSIISSVRGISAVGSAQHWQCWGQEFESPMLHHKTTLNSTTRLVSFFYQIKFSEGVVGDWVEERIIFLDMI